MLKIRRADERGHFDHGWLNTYHTFSFADYHDPAFMGFRSLRVMNEDRVQPGNGFGTHGHRDMEIITYVLEGALEHKDSLGNGSVLRPGQFQRMSAGTGVLHSEFNPSETELVHFYQIWLLPAQTGVKPSYEERRFSEEQQRGTFRLVASQDGRDGSLTVHQDADVYLAALRAGDEATHALRPGRSAWLQVLRGEVALDGHELRAGDGVAVSGEEVLGLRSQGSADVMLFDLA